LFGEDHDVFLFNYVVETFHFVKRLLIFVALAFLFSTLTPFFALNITPLVFLFFCLAFPVVDFLSLNLILLPIALHFHFFFLFWIQDSWPQICLKERRLIFFHTLLENISLVLDYVPHCDRLVIRTECHHPRCKFSVCISTDTDISPVLNRKIPCFLHFIFFLNYALQFQLAKFIF